MNEQGTLAPNEKSETIDVASFGTSPALEKLSELAARNARTSVGNLWGSSQSLVLAMLVERTTHPWLAVVSSESEAETLLDDLSVFGVRAALLPARESSHAAMREDHADPDTVRMRLQAAQELAGPRQRRPRVVVASALSLIQPVPSRASIERDILALTVNQRLDVDALLERLIGSGYARQPLAEKPGEVSVRGEIVDVYPFAAELPVRIEMFDDVVESLRVFDPVDQRSVSSSNRIEILLASDAGDVEHGRGAMPMSLFDADTVIARFEPLRIDERVESLRIRSAAHTRSLMEFTGQADRHRQVEIQSLPGRDLNFDARSVQALAVGMKDAPAALRGAATDGTRVIVWCQSAAERHRLESAMGDTDGAAVIETRLGSIGKGFRLPSMRVVMLDHRELLGVVGRRAAPKPHAMHRARAVQSFFELKVGDLVVHAVHGLARYAGLKRLERAGGEEEHLHLLFAEDVSLYVPASRIDLVQRYIGTGTANPALDKIGSNSFRRRKERVERALFDLATDLLDVQARRALHTREPWPADDALVREMIAAFPHVDTKDQVQVDREIRTDLSSDRPMDRLLCGDVGFGKTEIAVRAAFRVVSGGGQVGVLVPTTVLAQQHFDTFRERLASFPVEIVTLSRYVTDAEAADVLDRLADGRVDIVIGTHRLLSEDVRFKNLALLIVDEEQRFGVAHKEHFKKLRAAVDLLTLTATPIPRTLHMSLAGVRDISALTTPPEGRQEIETILAYLQDDEMLVEALQREKNRGGQVFYLHNRVDSIVQAALRVQQLLPGASVAIGHGQMGARDLRHVMDGFTSGEIDVLVATTIIESGIDIPAAGTIIIDHADHFGLSELHQLRGRVGRGAHKGYCYLLVDKHQPLRSVARERLKVLEEMNHLGAGFAISMKDLEIRGAGNILGPQQSGNIGAVGYDMYCRLLKHTIERIQAGEDLEGIVKHAPEEEDLELELGLRAYLPDEWIPDPRTRLELLREMSSIHRDEDAARTLESMHDRFGRVPIEAQSLVRIFRLKSRLAHVGLSRLTWHPGFYIVEYKDRVALERGLKLSAVELRPLKAGVAHMIVPVRHATAEAALDWFEGLLQADPEPGRPHDFHLMSSIFLPALCALPIAAVQSGAPQPAAGSAREGWRELDRVVVIVNEDIVTSHVLFRDYEQLRRARSVHNENDAARARNEILVEQVKEKLSVQAGRNMGLETALVEAQVDDHLKRVVERYDGVVGLSEFLQSKDLSSTDARDQVRDRLYSDVWEQFVTGESAVPGGRISVDTYVRPGQMRFMYEASIERPEMLSRIGGAPQSVVLQFMMIDPATTGGADAARGLADELRRRILDGEDMSELNDRFGASKTASTITAPLDEARLVQVDPAIGAFVRDAKAGDVSDVAPYVSDGKTFYRFIRLVQRTAGAKPELASREVQQLLKRRAEEHLAELRKQQALDDLLQDSYVWPPEVFRRDPSQSLPTTE